MGQDRRRVSAAQPVDKGLRMRMAALAGAAYHSHGAPHPDAPYFLRPLSLDQVVGHLADEEPGVRLQGAAWLLDGPPHPARKSDLHDAAARVLGPEYSMRGLADDPEPGTPAIGGRVRSRGGERSRCARILTSLDERKPRACPRRNFHLWVDQDPHTLVTSVQSEVEVNRPLGDFTVMADPQDWSTDAPYFWTTSRLVVDTGDQYAPVPDPPAPGSRPYVGLLEEVITLGLNPFFPIIGTNVLSTSYTNSCDPYGFDVSLFQCESTTIGGSTQAGGIDVDSGSLKLSSVPGDPGWTKMTATKDVRFTSRDVCGWDAGVWLNVFAPFVIGAFIGLLVYEGACFGAH